MATIVPLRTEIGRQPAPQTRGYYMTLQRTMTPRQLETDIGRIVEAGFNLLLFPIFNNGWTLFPSDAARSASMPAINPLFRKWNPLALVTALAAQGGLGVWGFARPYNFHPRFWLAEHNLLRKHPAWRLEAHPDYQTASARRFGQWRPCLVNRDYRRFVGDVLAEAVTGYAIDGVVLNLSGLGLRGGSLKDCPFCFCRACREAFAEDLEGEDLVRAATQWPIDSIRAWHLQQVHQHILYLRHRVLRAKRSSRLIARTRPTWREPAARVDPIHGGDSLLDWPTLLTGGTVESLVIDHDGEPCNELFSARLAADYAFLGDRVLNLPMVSVGSNLGDLSLALDAINRFPVPGFITELERPLSAERARELRETVFRQPAILPEAQPIHTAIYLLEQVRATHSDIPVLHDLLRDLLRLLGRQLPIPEDFPLLEIIEQNVQGLEQFIRRGRLGQARIPEQTLRNLGLARRFVRMGCMDIRT